jgi:hypothetical protein
VLQQSVIRLRCGVVELVNDDHIEVITGKVVEIHPVQTLNRRKNVLKVGRSASANPLLAETGVAERMAKGRLTLIEDLLAMGNKEQAGAPLEQAGSLCLPFKLAIASKVEYPQEAVAANSDAALKLYLCRVASGATAHQEESRPP